MLKLRYLLTVGIALMAMDASAQLAPGQPLPSSDPNGAYCREYMQKVVIGGVTRDSYGTACRQPDGAWRVITTDQQDLPEEIQYVSEPIYISPPRYVVPPPVYYEYESYPYVPYPYYTPYRGPYYGGGVNISIGHSYHGGHHGYHQGGWHH